MKDGEEIQPNIILFLFDDMGLQNTSVTFWKEETKFNKYYHTPGMERLVTEGMIFTQSYATSVCSPTRVRLMSGINAARHRGTNWTLRRNVLQDDNYDILDFSDWNVNGVQTFDTKARLMKVVSLCQ